MPEGVRVKICGLTRREDALEADRLGADYLGVIMSEGFGRSVEASVAGDLLEGSAALKVAVLVNEVPDRAEELAGLLDADVIQLHGDEAPDVVVELRERGGWALWKAVRAHSIQDLERAVGVYSALVDGLLLEGRREGRVGGAGATLRLDPDLVRRLVPTKLDFVLAGGLTPSSVVEAVARFGPDIVDVSSGIERVRGEKDPDLVRTFIESARHAGGRAAE
jgi:phosphoribosylanthranilate isomerase